MAFSIPNTIFMEFVDAFCPESHAVAGLLDQTITAIWAAGTHDLGVTRAEELRKSEGGDVDVIDH